MKRMIMHKTIIALFILSLLGGCKMAQPPLTPGSKPMPSSFRGVMDSASVTKINWR
jgi:hypothetical protein